MNFNILAGGEVKKVDHGAFIEWLHSGVGNRVAVDTRMSPDGELTVSTILNPVGLPWETMVFREDDPIRRESCGGTLEDAKAMHARVLADVDAGNPAGA